MTRSPDRLAKGGDTGRPFFEEYFSTLVVEKNNIVRTTVRPRNNSLAFKGYPSIKVIIFRSQTVVFNVISLLFKGYSEIKVKILVPMEPMRRGPTVFTS